MAAESTDHPSSGPNKRVWCMNRTDGLWIGMKLLGLYFLITGLAGLGHSIFGKSDDRAGAECLYPGGGNNFLRHLR